MGKSLRLHKPEQTTLPAISFVPTQGSSRTSHALVEFCNEMVKHISANDSFSPSPVQMMFCGSDHKWVMKPRR